MILEPKSIKTRIDNPPKFIVVEGLNGAGKSTLCQGLAERLISNGHAVIVTREPGATQLGGKVRDIVLKTPDIDPVTELLLFAADRAEHVTKILSPSINAGKTVLCDRYFYSTTAFQGYGRNMDLSMIDKINSIATKGLKPDLVLLLDLSPKLGLERNVAHGGKDDVFESAALEFHTRVRDGFWEIARTAKEPFILVDGAKSREEILNEAWSIIS